MSCLNPRIRVPFDLDEGTEVDYAMPTETFYLDGTVREHRQRVHNKAIILPTVYDPRWHLEMYSDWFDDHLPGAMAIPCGTCYACRLNRKLDTTQRLVAESIDYLKADNSQVNFITFTYNEESVPWGLQAFRYNGTPTVDWVHSLNKSDLQKFMKVFRQRLRREFGWSEERAENVKMYSCGEYGSKGNRPHYHMILYGVPESVLLSYNPRESRRGNTLAHPNLFISDYFESLWGKGFVKYERADSGTMAYTAGYVIKKIKDEYQKESEEHLYALATGKPVEYESYRNGFRERRPDDLREPEYRWGSLGLGKRWYEQHKHDLRADPDCDQIDGLMKIPLKPALYYDRLYESEFPEDYAALKERRLVKAAKLRATTLATNHYNLNLIKEKNKNTVMARVERAKRRDQFYD